MLSSLLLFQFHGLQLSCEEKPYLHTLSSWTGFQAMKQQAPATTWRAMRSTSTTLTTASMFVSRYHHQWTPMYWMTSLQIPSITYELRPRRRALRAQAPWPYKSRHMNTVSSWSSSALCLALLTINCTDARLEWTALSLNLMTYNCFLFCHFFSQVW